MRKKLTVALLGLLALGAGAWALALENPAEAPNPNDPSVSQVYDAARAGHLDQAHQMITQVLANHPRSARAHYVAAEIDADMKNYGEAREELRIAEQIDPGLPNVNPQSVAALRREIGATAAGQPGLSRQMIVPAQQAPKPFPWSTVLIIAAVVFVAWLLFRRRQGPAAYNPYPGTMPNTMGPGGVMPPPGGFPSVMGGAGSGIVGGLASGLAVGAGVAAGEELVRHAFGGSAGVPEQRFEPNEAQPPVDPNADLGGPDFGISGGGWDDGGGSSGGDDGGGWT
jgi:hypothetical protein